MSNHRKNGKHDPPPIGPTVQLWMTIADSNPYTRGTGRWYAFAYICRYATGWAQSVDNYRECRSRDSKELYRPTAEHNSNRLAACLHLIENLSHADDNDPLYKKRSGTTRAQRKRGL